MYDLIEQETYIVGKNEGNSESLCRLSRRFLEKKYDRLFVLQLKSLLYRNTRRAEKSIKHTCLFVSEYPTMCLLRLNIDISPYQTPEILIFERFRFCFTDYTEHKKYVEVLIS